MQEAFIAHDAMQCGYCTPGMVMSCAALLEHNPAPDAEDVQAAISGHICRCGTYPHVLDAMLAVGQDAKDLIMAGDTTADEKFPFGIAGVGLSEIERRVPGRRTAAAAGQQRASGHRQAGAAAGRPRQGHRRGAIHRGYEIAGMLHAPHPALADAACPRAGDRHRRRRAPARRARRAGDRARRTAILRYVGAPVAAVAADVTPPPPTRRCG